ncbi:MAG: DUF1287 domain-containing protein [Hyphomicrobiaceae bacterium]|nr:DUF1287 domain-containing protein [Hyphomicrobiaceae bacterium]
MKKAKHRKPKAKARRQSTAATLTSQRVPSRANAPSRRVGANATIRQEAGRGYVITDSFVRWREAGAAASRSTARWVRGMPRAITRALPLEPEDREVAVLLLAPFFILAMAIAVNQSAQISRHLRALIARPVPPVMLPATNDGAQQTALAPLARPSVIASPDGAGIRAEISASRAPDGAGTARLVRQGTVIAASRSTDLTRQAAWLPQSIMPVMTKLQPAVASGAPPVATAPAANEIAALSPQALAATAPGLVTVSLQAAAPAPRALLGTGGLVQLDAYDEHLWTNNGRVALDERCELGYEKRLEKVAAAQVASGGAILLASTPDASFGARLAEAARRQLSSFVIYDDAYRSITYPRGDVPPLYGVCTDVVIRAYRALGIDLQVAVQKARVGSGDRNIDHRRTETLRRFFARVGENLPVTSYAEDFLPGDIVTYARPQNTGSSSRSHIAIVSDVVAPSGRPMILHNRGWGPQLEDALFVDRITGHYRYAGVEGVAPVRAVDGNAERRASASARLAAPPQRKAGTARTASVSQAAARALSASR